MTKIISGTQIRNQILVELRAEVEGLKSHGIQPALAVILVGDDPASAVYVRNKQKTCEELGILSVGKKLSADTSQKQLLEIVDELNHDPRIHGILCQVPLPDKCNEQEVILAISPDKDVDCFHPLNVGLLISGAPRFMPCTPFGILQMLKRSSIETAGKKVVILGRSNIVGRPLSILISQKGLDATVTLCHSKTKDLAEICRTADILVAAIGRPEFVTAEFVREGAVVIDVGTNRVTAPERPRGYKLTGDVDYKAVGEKVSAITPVPGGVGPMTIAMLMYNTINAARFFNQLPTFIL